MNKNIKGSNNKSGGSQRQNMVASTVRRVLATAIITKNISAPDLRAEIISVMDVKMSPDLKQARVFISVIGEESECQQQLKNGRRRL